MNHLHYQFDAGPDEVVEVTLDHQANVLLMDDSNYNNYRHSRSFRYYGGHATRSPVRLVPPRQARWNIVVDLGGGTGRVKAGVRVLSEELARN